MEFDFTEEQKLIVETARKVGENFGPAYWRDIDSEKEFPRKFWDAVCEAGLAATMVPEEYGGSGLGMQEMAMIVYLLPKR